MAAVRLLSTLGQHRDMVHARFPELLRSLMAERGIGVRALARDVPCNAGHISKILNGHKRPSPKLAAILDKMLDADGTLAELAAALAPASSVSSPAGDELAAVELARRATASDVGAATVQRLELAVDDLAVAYPGTPPAELAERVRAHLGYVSGLLDGRVTLTEHRRLLVVAGWLSLLAATCAIDLHHDPAAAAHLRTASQLAGEAGHAEIAAWCMETRAWQVLTAGNYQGAAELARAAQHAAPERSSAYIQATAQEGRALARLGDATGTRDVLTRVETLVSPLPAPDRPEHHYRYDPAKADAYTATTLSWIGDPAAERYVRTVLGRLESATAGPPRPRRAASARLDLGLALIAGDQHDEAAAVTLDAITSGRLVPSNYWRAAEVVTAVADRGLPEAADLTDAYRQTCHPEPTRQLS